MTTSFSHLEKNILKAKGVSDADLDALVTAGVASRADFATVGDAATLIELVPGLPAEVAAVVMSWALGKSAVMASGVAVSAPGVPSFTVESPDAVYCMHCKTKQPKDHKSGDLCISCGKQAEPILACYWCYSSGPGKFCRQCGAEFVTTSELELAVLLKREGIAKEDVSRKLKAMSQADKDVLWGRVRKARG